MACTAGVHRGRIGPAAAAACRSTEESEPGGRWRPDFQRSLDGPQGVLLPRTPARGKVDGRRGLGMRRAAGVGFKNSKRIDESVRGSSLDQGKIQGKTELDESLF